MESKPLLKIIDLHVATQEEGKTILQGINLEIYPGETHLLLGDNGAGKSTLMAVITGKPGYTVTQGQLLYQERDLLSYSVEARAQAGIMLAFQQPIALPGVPMMTFLKTALNVQREARGESPLDAAAFLRRVKETQTRLGLHDSLLKRPVNQDFSGGERKRSELFQVALFEPRLTLWDETDSGLDTEGRALLATLLSYLTQPSKAHLIITHYPDILSYCTPDVVHVLDKGKIIARGDRRLAQAHLSLAPHQAAPTHP